MKITETEKGNIKLVMTKVQANSLFKLLDTMSLIDYESILHDEDDESKICDLWDTLLINRHLYD